MNNPAGFTPMSAGNLGLLGINNPNVMDWNIPQFGQDIQPFGAPPMPMYGAQMQQGLLDALTNPQAPYTGPGGNAVAQQPQLPTIHNNPWQQEIFARIPGPFRQWVTPDGHVPQWVIDQVMG